MEQFRVAAVASTDPTRPGLDNSLIVGHIVGARSTVPMVFWKGEQVHGADYAEGQQMPAGTTPQVVVLFSKDAAVTFNVGGKCVFRGETLTVCPAGGVIDFDLDRYLPVC